MDIGQFRNSTICFDSFTAMGTHLEIVMPCNQGEDPNAIFSVIRKEVHRLDRKLSHYSPKSFVQKINACAGESPVRVDKELWELLQQCEEHRHRTSGYFDIVESGQESLAKNGSGHGTEQECAEVGERFALNASRRTIRFENRTCRITFAAIGKGYALDRILALLHAHDVNNALVSFGGSSILALGTPPGAEHWRIGMDNPEEPEGDTSAITVRNACLSVSGNGLSGDRREGTHLMNPKTGREVSTKGTVTVIANSGAESEALSTALFVAPAIEHDDILSRYPGARVITDKEKRSGNTE